MTNQIFFISDTHFGHANILTFKRNDGGPLRAFSCVEEMDEHMVEQWNSVVRPQDKVYHLGDVVLNKNHMYILARLNGHKRLVRGNHDIYRTELYSQYFEEIHGVRVFNGLPNRLRIAATHVPIHPECGSRWQLNVHGHLHSNNIKRTISGYAQQYGNKIFRNWSDPRYYNVSVEQIDYTPIPMETLIEHAQEFNLV